MKRAASVAQRVGQVERRGVRIGDLSRGALSGSVGGRDVHYESHGRDAGAAGHPVESGRIVALVRDPEGAAHPETKRPKGSPNAGPLARLVRGCRRPDSRLKVVAGGRVRFFLTTEGLKVSRPSRPRRYSPSRTGPRAAPPRPGGPSTRRYRRKRVSPSTYPSLLMRARALATVRVWKKRLELQAHSRFNFRGGCGLPVATGVRTPGPGHP